MLKKLFSRVSSQTRFFSESSEQTPIYSGITFYSKSSAINVSPIAPRLVQTKNYLRLQTPGKIKLGVAPMSGKQAQWRSNPHIQLDAVDVAQILNWSDKKLEIVKEFASQAEGVKNSQRVLRLQRSEAGDCIISVSTQGEAQQTSSSFQLSVPQLHTLQMLLSAAVPKMYLWDQAFEPLMNQDDSIPE
eukprot:TRINITY_DN7203_c0_g1_i5.p1 TRINITY_DN7203_c0_g1~~TRINITY_DN7203_c0_g1_i5.p1  ORF type:complete len:188 (+),score=23.18 TRINITY_DN7203_c0_g1_i5:54-617(+)